MQHWGFAAAAAVALVSGPAGAQRSGPTAETSPSAAHGMVLMASSLPSSDLDRSIAFYTKGLGMTAGGGAGPGEVTLAFPGGGAYLQLQKAPPGTNPLPVRTMLSRVTLIVPDLKALVARLAAAGYPLKGKINEMAQYHVMIAQFQDPDGNPVELVQRGP